MKTIVMMVAIVASVFGMQSCAAQQQGDVDYKNAFLVDVRTPQEVAEGTVDGSVNIPLNELEQRLAEFEGKGQIVVFCRSGGRSGQAKTILEKNGHTNVVNGGTWEQVQAKVAAEKK
jgi:rhodanese-related sulfurtransferase